MITQAPGTILIVEDEVLIADGIERSLLAAGHRVVGQAISYREATALALEHYPDLALLDIRINSPESGIDVGAYLNGLPQPIPFIYLTSQSDAAHLARAKATAPLGYLVKPIQTESLLSSIEVALHNHRRTRAPATLPWLPAGPEHPAVEADDIAYLKADHVYVEVHLRGGRVLHLRESLGVLQAKLPDYFVQSHRSYVFDMRAVTRISVRGLHLRDAIIPVSRSRTQEVQHWMAVLDATRRMPSADIQRERSITRQ